MDEIKIEIFKLKLVEGCLECSLCRLVPGIFHPNLRSHKERLAINSAFLDASADSFFILIHLGGVDQSIASSDGVCDALRTHIAPKTIGTKAQHGHHHTVAEPHLRDRSLLIS